MQFTRIIGFATVVFVAACSSTDGASSSGATTDPNQLSPACTLLASCCDRWPADLRRSCSGPASVPGAEGESSCKALFSNGAAVVAYCPELDIGNCSAELRAVMGDKCGGVPPVVVGLETFAASNIGKITLPDGIADVTLGDGAKFTACDVDTASGKSTCLTGTNAFVAKTIGNFDVLFAKSIVVGAKSQVTLSGTRPVILVAATSITVNGLLDIGYVEVLTGTVERGGAQETGVGVGGQYSGGGAYCGKGGDGFSDKNGSQGVGGKVYGNATLIPLVGGSSSYDASDGPGGGAVQLVAGSKVTVAGVINASGKTGYNSGGGSGGAILVEAPQIDGAGQVVSNGGAGAMNHNANQGAGTGGGGDAPDGTPATYAYAAGGGGAGRIRLNARSQNFTGKLSPSAKSPCATTGELAP